MQFEVKRDEFSCELIATEHRMVREVSLFTEYNTVMMLVDQISIGRPVCGKFTINTKVCDSVEQFEQLLASFQEGLDAGLDAGDAVIGAIALTIAEKELRKSAFRALKNGYVRINMHDAEDKARSLLQGSKV